MASQELRDELTSYLGDVHSTEQDATARPRAGADQAGEPALRAAFQQHLAETEVR